MYYVYILDCADTTLYIGIATNLEKRIREHNESRIGARYTKSRRPVRLAYSEIAETRSAALKREAELKKLARVQKLALIDNVHRDTLISLPATHFYMAKGQDARKEKKKPKKVKK